MEYTLSRDPTLYPASRAAELTGLTRAQLARGVREGWIRPAGSFLGVAQFDYQQLAGLRRLARLFAAGFSERLAARQLTQFRAWSGQVEVGPVSATGRGKKSRIIFRTPRGRLVESRGQSVFEFEIPRQRSAISLPNPDAQERLLELALAKEAAGEAATAAKIYRTLLARWPSDAQLWFNYGNSLYAQGRAENAAAAYRRAVRLDRQHAGAWNNLGGALMDLGKLPAAEKALRMAMRLDKQLAEPRENLADLWRMC